MKSTPYIAKIVEFYQTGNGNYFCREEGNQELEHHLDWEIFIPEDITKNIQGVPFWGIIVTDYNHQFFNGESRLTCRVLSYNRNDLERIFEEDQSLDKEIEESIEKYKVQLEAYYAKSNQCEFAIKELKNILSVQEWLQKNQKLFEKVTISPAGLPIIADSNFNGTSFEEIKEFVKLYESLNTL